ncbi:hypothetical protein PUN28_006623 [Cardiocondyla obscurior]|uniref:Uncharacterized protein n=1 Tax=Cardiocondyla obscurior TaxID=286306 RepID=A0AAW2GC24_9HYME
MSAITSERVFSIAGHVSRPSSCIPFLPSVRRVGPTGLFFFLFAFFPPSLALLRTDDALHSRFKAGQFMIEFLNCHLSSDKQLFAPTISELSSTWPSTVLNKLSAHFVRTYPCKKKKFARIFRHGRNLKLRARACWNRMHRHTIYLAAAKRVYRGERDSHRVCASDLPIEIAPAITKVGQSVVSPAAAHGNGREKYERNENGGCISLSGHQSFK